MTFTMFAFVQTRGHQANIHFLRYFTSLIHAVLHWKSTDVGVTPALTRVASLPHLGFYLLLKKTKTAFFKNSPSILML